MTITRDSTLDLDQIGLRIRILSGISVVEISDSTMSEIISMGSEWFEEQTGLTYTVNTDNSYDNAVVFYAKIATSVKTTTYNAHSSTGDVDWKKNIDGSEGTLNVRRNPRNI